MDVEVRDWQDGDVEWWLPLRMPCAPRIGEQIARSIAAGELLPFLLRRVAEAANIPIRALNESLGYRPTDGEYRLRYDPP